MYTISPMHSANFCLCHLYITNLQEASICISCEEKLKIKSLSFRVSAQADIRLKEMTHLNHLAQCPTHSKHAMDVS